MKIVKIMRNIRKKVLVTSILLVYLIGYNTAFGQSKFIVVSPSSNYNKTFECNKDANIFKIPVHDNPLQSILNGLQKQKYSELHVYALTEHNMIGFHGLALLDRTLNKHNSLLTQFKKYKLKIIVHSTVLGTTPNGKEFLSKLSLLMGNKIEVQK